LFCFFDVLCEVSDSVVFVAISNASHCVAWESTSTRREADSFILSVEDAEESSEKGTTEHDAVRTLRKAGDLCLAPEGPLAMFCLVNVDGDVLQWD